MTRIWNINRKYFDPWLFFSYLFFCVFRLSAPQPRRLWCLRCGPLIFITNLGRGIKNPVPPCPSWWVVFRYSFKYLDCGFKQLTCCQISSNGLRKKENRRLNFWKSLESFYCLLFPQQSRLNMYLITSHWPKLYLFPITMDWNRLSIKWYMYIISLITFSLLSW